MECHVRDAVETFEVGGGFVFFWRGVREKGGSSEPPEPPLVTGLLIIQILKFRNVSVAHECICIQLDAPGSFELINK